MANALFTLHLTYYSNISQMPDGSWPHRMDGIYGPTTGSDDSNVRILNFNPPRTWTTVGGLNMQRNIENGTPNLILSTEKLTGLPSASGLPVIVGWTPSAFIGNEVFSENNLWIKGNPKRPLSFSPLLTTSSLGFSNAWYFEFAPTKLSVTSWNNMKTNGGHIRFVRSETETPK